jgi:hypothetical protein
MSERDDGGPAFLGVDERGNACAGMSLRDAAALEAMKALIGCAHGAPGWRHLTREDIVREAFLYADEFLKARKQ